MLETDPGKNLAYRDEDTYSRTQDILREKGEHVLQTSEESRWASGISTTTDIYHIDGATVLLKGVFEWYLPRNLVYQYMKFAVASGDEEKEEKILADLEKLVQTSIPIPSE